MLALKKIDPEAAKPLIEKWNADLMNRASSNALKRTPSPSRPAPPLR